MVQSDQMEIHEGKNDRQSSPILEDTQSFTHNRDFAVDYHWKKIEREVAGEEDGHLPDSHAAGRFYLSRILRWLHDEMSSGILINPVCLCRFAKSILQG